MKQTTVDILHKQYSEDSAHLRLLVRTRLFMAWGLLAIMALMLAQGTAPGNPQGLLQKAELFKVSLTLDQIDPRLLNSLLWALYVGLAVQSYHRSLLVEFQAKYVGVLEARLNELLGSALIDRQAQTRPAFFRKTTWFYFGVFALIIEVLPIVKMAVEAVDLSAESLSLAFFCFDLIMIGVFYWYSWHFWKEMKEWTGLTSPKDDEEGRSA